MKAETILQVGRWSGGFVVHISGPGTMQHSAAFREFVSQCFEFRQASVVFDVEECDYLDSTFLGCLIGLHKQCERGGSRFLIAADDSQRVRLFTTSVLDQFLNFTPTCPIVTSELVPLETPELTRQQLGQHVMQSHRKLAELGGEEATAFQSIADRLADELDR